MALTERLDGGGSGRASLAAAREASKPVSALQFGVDAGPVVPGTGAWSGGDGARRVSGGSTARSFSAGAIGGNTLGAQVNRPRGLSDSGGSGRGSNFTGFVMPSSTVEQPSPRRAQARATSASKVVDDAFLYGASKQDVFNVHATQLMQRFGEGREVSNYITMDVPQRQALEEHGLTNEEYEVLQCSPSWKKHLMQRKTNRPQAKSAALPQKRAWGKRHFYSHPSKDPTIEKLVFGRSVSEPMLKAMRESGAFPVHESQQGASKSKAGKSGFDHHRRNKKKAVGRRDTMDLTHDEQAEVEHPYRGDECVPLRQHSELAYAMMADEIPYDGADMKFPSHFRDRFSGAAGSPSWFSAGSGRKYAETGPEHRASVAGAVLMSKPERKQIYENNPNETTNVDAVVYGHTRDMDENTFRKVYRGCAGQASWERPTEENHQGPPGANKHYGQRRGIKVSARTPCMKSNFLQAAYNRNETFEQDPAHHEQVVIATYDGSAGRASWHHTHHGKKIEELRPATASQPLNLAHNIERRSVPEARRQRLRSAPAESRRYRARSRTHR